MNYQVRAFQISFLLHGVIIALIIMGSTLISQSKKAMVMDFDLRQSSSGIKQLAGQTAPLIKTKSMNSTARQIFKEREPTIVSQEVSRIPSVPETPPVVKLPEAGNLESQPMEPGIPSKTGAVQERSGTSSSMVHAAGGKESARIKYLNDHFAYIRDKILWNVSYPDMARRKGWQGKVLLSFIITTNGSVREFRIIKSSGFPMLDRSAIETVKDTAPFPRPPVEAQLVIPIVYRLE